MYHLSLKKLIIVHLLAMIFLCMFLLVFAGHIAQDDPAIAWNQNQPNSFQYSEPEARIPSVPPNRLDFQQLQQYNRESELTEDQLTYLDESGEPNINKIRNWNKLNKATRDRVLSKLTDRQIITEEPVNGKVVGKGIQFESIRFLKIDKTSLTNAIGVVYDGNKLKFKSADSVLTDNSASTNIQNYEGYEDSFSVNYADSFLSDCIRVDNIKDSKFKVSNKVEITTKLDVNLQITDCSYNEVIFSGKGRISIDKSSDNPQYILENGTLTKKEEGYNETIESNNSIIIDTDKTFGFKCLTITPVGSYFYNDKDLRKDFIINIPKESSTYKLCLRKNTAQRFQGYNGLVDFVDKKIELKGIVNYLRYPFKDKQLLSLLSDFVYQGFDLNNKATIKLDKDLLFMNDLFVDNKNPNENISISNSGYHGIIEIKGTRFVKISRTKFYPNLIRQYNASFQESIITIKNETLTQNGNTKVKILSVNSPDVKKAELFLQNYWNRKQNIKLSEYLE